MVEELRKYAELKTFALILTKELREHIESILKSIFTLSENYENIGEALKLIEETVNACNFLLKNFSLPEHEESLIKYVKKESELLKKTSGFLEAWKELVSQDKAIAVMKIFITRFITMCSIVILYILIGRFKVISEIYAEYEEKVKEIEAKIEKQLRRLAESATYII